MEKEEQRIEWLPSTMRRYWSERKARGYARGGVDDDGAGRRFTGPQVGVWQLFVRTLQGQLLTIRAGPNDTIEALKFKVWALEGIPAGTLT
jgi:hypothetical protein